jgi:hypothetical protein
MKKSGSVRFWQATALTEEIQRIYKPTRLEFAARTSTPNFRLRVARLAAAADTKMPGAGRRAQLNVSHFANTANDGGAQEKSALSSPPSC